MSADVTPQDVAVPWLSPSSLYRYQAPSSKNRDFGSAEDLITDLRILGYDPLIPPSLLQHELPLTVQSKRTVLEARGEIESLVNGVDGKQRLLVIVGPCSIHDPSMALEYCHRLLILKEKLKDDLMIVMRSYLEVPTYTTEWKGLINDPNINNSFMINKGLRLGRKLFLDLTERGMPIASELLDTLSPIYLTDLLSVGEIGSRTTESEPHRQLASGLSFPVGFKNGTDGSLGIAIDAIIAAKHRHHFLSVNSTGLTSIARTIGNNDCFAIIRGYLRSYNDAASIAEVQQALKAAGLPGRLMLDCSHGKSLQGYKNQLKIAEGLISSGDAGIMGVTIKSNIFEGNQKIPEERKEGKAEISYGVSITDPCLGWEDTERALETLAIATRQRRVVLGKINDPEKTNHHSSHTTPSHTTLPEQSTYATSSAANDGFLRSGERLVMKDVDTTGWLRAPLGELTPPRKWTRFNTRKVKWVPYFGEILTREDFEKFFISIPDFPPSIKVQAINPKSLESLSRSDRRILLEKLSGTKTRICVTDATGNCLTKKHSFQTNFSNVTLATMMAVAVALRGTHSRLFAELVALAPPDTMNELQPFCRPPFMTLSDIPYLVHGAARNIAHHHGRSPDPPRTAKGIGDILAFLLRHTKDMNDENRNSLAQLFHTMLIKWSDDRDRGIQVGLTMAGIRKYVIQGRDDLSKRIDIGKMILDTIFGGLTGVPIGGVVPATLQAVAGAAFRRRGDEKLQQWEDLKAHYNSLYHSAIDYPIFLDGFIDSKDEQGNVVRVKVKAKDFREFANTMLEWNGGTI